MSCVTTEVCLRTALSTNDMMAAPIILISFPLTSNPSPPGWGLSEILVFHLKCFELRAKKSCEVAWGVRGL